MNLMKQSLVITSVAAALSLSVVSPASANLFDIYANAKGGYVGGRGVTDLTESGADFFELESGPTFGFELGVELLFIDVSFAGYRFLGEGPASKVDTSDSGGTLFELLAGIDVDIPLDGGSHPRLNLRLGGNAGIGFGQHRTVMPPLTKDQVANYGFVMHGIAALEYYLTSWLYIGAEVNPGYHYFLAGGDAVVNDYSQGMQFMGFVTTGIRLQPFSSGEKKSNYRPYRTPSTAPKPAAAPRP